MSVAEILNLASSLLEDTMTQGGVTGLTWPQDPLLLRYLNLANIEIVNLRPEAYPVNVNISLIPGTTQNLPSGANDLIDITKNIGIGGGMAITRIERSILDNVLPYWQVIPADNDVLYVIYDEKTPTIFYVYPPRFIDIEQKIELIYHSAPLTGNNALVAGTEQTFNILGGRILLDAVRNTIGPHRHLGITRINRKNLDSLFPNWRHAEVDSQVKFIMIDEINPQRFYVFPPQPINPYQQIEVVYQPDPVTEVVSIGSGPKQSLPISAMVLIDPVRNMGADGKTAGRSITKIDKNTIDAVAPGWLDYMVTGEVQFYILDEQNPKVFYVFPPQPAGTAQKVSAIVSQRPPSISSISGGSPLDDSYIPLQVKRVVSLALMEETTVPNAINKAKELYAEFLQEIQAEVQNDKGLPSRRSSKAAADLMQQRTVGEQQKNQGQQKQG